MRSDSGFGGGIIVSSLAPGMAPPTPYQNDVYLHPMQQPIWDTEVYNPKSKTSELEFFCRPIGSTMQFTTDIKDEGCTILKTPRRIEAPCSFSVLGFKALLQRGASEADKCALIDGTEVDSPGVFHFKAGAEELLSLPLLAMPGTAAHEQYDKAVALLRDESIPWEKLQAIGDVLRSVTAADQYHKFTMGRAAWKLRYDADFSASITWKVPPSVSRPISIMVVVVGLWWKPFNLRSDSRGA